MGRPLELYAATMPTVRRKVAEHNSSSAERIHELVMDLVRATGLLQPERTVPGHPLSMSQAFALHELDTDTPLSRSEEHTSELQSRGHLVCRLLLEKKT